MSTTATPTQCCPDRVAACFTRPGWAVATSPGEALAAPRGSLDAVVLQAEPDPDHLAPIASALKPLGRLIVTDDYEANQRLDQAIDSPTPDEQDPNLCVTSRLITDDWRRVFVAERPGDAGLPGRRADAHPGAYKMSRYRAYHQMHAAIARLVPPDSRDVIEIGDSNGVIRDMLGQDRLNYFRAHYPPHDLQNLRLLTDESCDVFICDNTLEHVADPHAAVGSMARVLRPGGWLVLFAPFIAMCQDDDRTRWSQRALTELLSEHFDAGMVGGWGNVEAACWYMRANKWLRVLEARRGGLICRDSRAADSPPPTLVEVPDRCDRLHPIHVWAVARRGGSDAPPPADCALHQYAGLNPALKPITAAVAAATGPGATVGVLAHDDGSLADRVSELGQKPVCLIGSPALGTAALNRGFQCVPSRGARLPSLAGPIDAVLCDPRTSGVSREQIADWFTRAVRPRGVAAIIGDPTAGAPLASALQATGFSIMATEAGAALLRRPA